MRWLCSISQSHSHLCSWGCSSLPPSRNSNYLEYTRSSRWCPKALREMGIPFAKTTELQYGFSMKCPSCPTICQQNGETSIQPAGFYIQREKRQAKIKKTSRRYFQQRNLCYWLICRIKTLLICDTQWETMPVNEKNFLLCDQYVSG